MDQLRGADDELIEYISAQLVKRFSESSDGRYTLAALRRSLPPAGVPSGDELERVAQFGVLIR